MAVTYEDDGGLAAVTGEATIDVDFPSTVNEDDFLWLMVVSRTTYEPSYPGGDWTGFGKSNNPNRSCMYAWMRATGSESGSVTVTLGASVDSYAVMIRVSGVITEGTPWGAAMGAGTVDEFPWFSINSMGGYQPGSLSVVLVGGLDDEGAIDDGVTYDEVFDYTSSLGSDGGAMCYTHAPPGGAMIPSDLVTFGIDGQFHCKAAVVLLAPHNVPKYKTPSTIAAATSTALNVNYPATVDAGDILFCKVGGGSNTHTWSTVVSGWTEIVDEGGGALYWKRATGSESGTALFTASGSATHSGVMYRWADCKETGTPYELAIHNYDTAGEVIIEDFVDDPSVDDTWCLAFTQVSDNRGGGSATHYFSKNQQLSTLGSDSAHHLYAFPCYAKENRPGADSYDINSFGLDYVTTSVLVLLPIAGGGPTGYANDVNTVGTAAIGKINGVATADIGKVNTA